MGLSATAIAVGPALAGGPGSGAPGPKPEQSDKPDKKQRDETTILVQFAQPGYNNDELVQQDGDHANGAVGDLKTKTVIVKLKKDADVDAKIAEYQARDDVIFAEPNGYASVTDDSGSYSAQDGLSGTGAMNAATVDAPNDEYYTSEWGLGAIHAFDAWQFFFSDFNAPDGPPIAIVDSGVDSLHPDLYGKVATAFGANCLTGVCVSDGAADDYGHGTHVAGIAAARANDGVGIAGVAFNAPIIPVKALDSTGSGTYASIASGIIWATDQGARVVNLSLGSTAYSQTVCDAVAYATSHGTTVVAAAGNLGVSTPFYPAACAGAVGVGATDSTDARASFSQTSYPNVFLSAPGVGIISDLPNGSYASDTGTSMAAPFVTGVADLLIGQNPGRTPMDVKLMLAGTADKVGGIAYASDPYATCLCTWNTSYGYGRVNAYRALSEAPPAPAPDFSMASTPLTLNVMRATSGNFTVSSSSTTGYTSAISLTVTGLPAGATASFLPTTITGVGSSTLKVTPSTSTPYGSYPLTIKGTSGTLVRTVQVTLNVPAPDYTLKLVPTSGTIIQSEKGTTAISLNNLYGFRSTVTLALSGVPAGVTATLGRTSTSGTTVVTLTFATTMTTTPGTWDITITGTSGTLVRTAVYTLTVAQAVPDFTIVSATTSTAVKYASGAKIIYKLTIKPKYGFIGTISLSASGTPPNSTGVFSVQPVNITSTALAYPTFTLTIPAYSQVGTYYVAITGTGYNGATHTVSPKITIA